MIRLSDRQPFARGGNRLCFVHPEFPDRVVKVRRPEYSLADMRRKKGFPRNLRPLSSFDENLKETAVICRLEQQHGDALYAVVSRNYGFVDTDMGEGLSLELIRNADGRIARSLMQYIWENGITPTLATALDRFEAAWLPLLVPTRDLLLHNVAAQCDADGNIVRLVVIDGLGASGPVPWHWLPRGYRLARTRRKLAKFRALAVELDATRQTGKIPSTFWQLRHDGLDGQDRDSGRG